MCHEYMYHEINHWVNTIEQQKKRDTKNKESAEYLTG